MSLMRLICLTGGIASGKTTVGRIFSEIGARVEDADDLARSLAATPKMREALTETLGRSFYTPSGELKRSELAAYIFQHPDALQKVNALIHPLVIAELDRRYERVEGEPGCFVVETALAVETGYADKFEVVVVVVSPRAERLRRLVEQDGFTPDQAVARMAAQLPQEEKVKRADYVLENNGSLEELEEKARALYEKLCTNE